MKPQEIGLILQGLRSIFVADSEAIRQRLIKRFEGELLGHGLVLRDTPVNYAFPQEGTAKARTLIDSVAGAPSLAKGKRPVGRPRNK